MHRLLPLLLVVIVALSACAPAVPREAQVAPPRVWFDSPLPGAVVTDTGACEILAHAASPQGVASVELWMNDIQDGSLHPVRESGSMTTYSRACDDLPPGEYALRLRARNATGDWSPYAETSMSILEAARDTPVPPPVSVSTPSPMPFTARQGSVSIESVSTGTIYAGGETCGPLDVTITARASAPGGVTVVVLFYRSDPVGSRSYRSTVMSPMGDGLYQATVSTASLLDAPAEASLQYQVVVQLADGDTSLRTPLMSDIVIQPCGTISTTTAGDCTQYQTKRACESRGCKWVLLPAIVPVYACGNP